MSGAGHPGSGHYFDRETGKLQSEAIFGDRALRFAYETALGRSWWNILFGSSLPSRLMGLFYDSRYSRKAIVRLARTPGCRTREAEKHLREYRSFNDFFTRRLKPECRPVDRRPDVLTAPGDGRLLVYPALHPTNVIPVKGAKRRLADLIPEFASPQEVAVAVLRLAPVDYHRFHFPCDCTQQKSTVVIPGKYHSVNPIALKHAPDLYVENTRQITLLHSELFEDFLMIEVGAFGVGSIIQTARPGIHRKMDEKGFFKFGGSTIILIFRSDAISFSEDLKETSWKEMEVLVRCGTEIGTIVR